MYMMIMSAIALSIIGTVLWARTRHKTPIREPEATEHTADFDALAAINDLAIKAKYGKSLHDGQEL